MVQREVGERLRRAPGVEDLRRDVGDRPAVVRGARAAPRAARRSSTRCPTSSPRSCVLRRVAPSPAAARDRARARRVRPSPQGAGGIARAGARRRPGVRDRARAALVEIGHPADVRAERLAPDDFARLAELIGWDAPRRGRAGAAVIRERAPAKVNLVLQVGDVRGDGLHELCSLFASLDLADELTIERLPDGARRPRRLCRRRRAEPRHAGARRAAYRARGDLPPLRSRSTSASRSRRDWAAAARTPRRCCARPTGSPDAARRRRSARDRRPHRRRRAQPDRASPRARHRRGRARRAASTCRRWRSCWSRRTMVCRPPTSTASRPDRVDSRAPRSRPAARAGRSSARRARALRWRTTWSPRRSTCARNSPASSRARGRRRAGRAHDRLGPDDVRRLRRPDRGRARRRGSIVERSRHGPAPP